MRIAVGVALCAALGCASSATNSSGGGTPTPTASDDKQLLQGKWLVVSAERNGKAEPEAEISDVVVSIEDDKISFIVDGKKQHAKMSFSLNSSKAPKQIDFTEWYLRPHGEIPGVLSGVHHVEEKTDTPKGVYELKDDTLTICKWNPGYRPASKTAVGTAEEGKSPPRPTSLAPADRKGITILILKRIK